MNQLLNYNQPAWLRVLLSKFPNRAIVLKVIKKKNAGICTFIRSAYQGLRKPTNVERRNQKPALIHISTTLCTILIKG